MSRKILLVVSVFSILVSRVPAQINLLSDAITFRDATNRNQTSTHHGNLHVFGEGSSSTPVFYVYNSTLSSVDRYAVKAKSIPQPYYGIGGRFEGGWKGVEGYAQLSGTGSRYGGYFYAQGGSGTNYGIYCSGSSYAGYFSGNVTVTGTFSNPSDKKFKQNIKPVNGCLTKIMKLNPVEYNYDADQYPALNFSKKKKIGLIAQEVEKIIPEIVSIGAVPVENAQPDADEKEALIEYKSIDYISLIPVLVAAVKEQQKQIDELKELLQ